jgi:hypothetical protein
VTGRKYFRSSKGGTPANTPRPLVVIQDLQDAYEEAMNRHDDEGARQLWAELRSRTARQDTVDAYVNSVRRNGPDSERSRDLLRDLGFRLVPI